MKNQPVMEINKIVRKFHSNPGQIYIHLTSILLNTQVSVLEMNKY